MVSKILSENEARSLEKVAVLRAECGRLRACIRDALDQAPPGTSVYAILTQALDAQEVAS